MPFFPAISSLLGRAKQTSTIMAKRVVVKMPQGSHTDDLFCMQHDPNGREHFMMAALYCIVLQTLGRAHTRQKIAKLSG